MEFLHLVSFFFIFLSGYFSTAISNGDRTYPLNTYIVHVHAPKPDVFATTSFKKEGWYNSFLPTSIASLGTSRMVYVYKNVMNGFAVRLTERELEQVAKMEGFIAAHPERSYSLQTTRTPEFVGLSLGTGLWNSSNYGEGVIIGVLDGGVLPAHPSFSDEEMPPPPARWRGRCDLHSFSCNNKIIGARTFLNGTTGLDPIDVDGHGTHTASTAAGVAVPRAEVLGNALGVAVGMAPKAHLAIYKVCGVEDCADSDILAAMDAAIEDGVDVLSISISSDPMPFFKDQMAIGAFAAIQKGVFVSCAGGNYGPSASSINNGAPWILTVAASTMDRSIRSTVMLGNGMELDGESIYQPRSSRGTFFPLVYPGGPGSKPDAVLCGNGSLDGLDVRGKIVLCERGVSARVDKGRVVKSAGGAGMILMNSLEDGYSILADAHVLPASHLSHHDGIKIKSYVNSSSKPMARFIFKGTLIGTSPARAIASFSSRGPSTITPGILKPDITGPGVSVLAAWPFAVGPRSKTSSLTFNIMSGTSMSTPHLSGIAALIKAAHPEWSPAAVKSAIMTTADVVDRSGGTILDERMKPADLFAMGAGHVNPERANDPGLVYDVSADDYVPYLCGLGYSSEQVAAIVGRSIDCAKVGMIVEAEFNYPSISVTLRGRDSSVEVKRRVKNVGEEGEKYWVDVDVPEEVWVSVEPAKLELPKVGEEVKYKVTFKRGNGGGGGGGGVVQGCLKWVSEKHVVRSPISITFQG